MWKIAAGRGGGDFDLFREGCFIAMGLNDIGDLTTTSSRKEVVTKVQNAYPSWPPGRISAWGGMLYRFQHEIGVEDYVITYNPIRRIYLVGTITSPCIYNPDRVLGSPYVREVTWSKEVERDALANSVKNSLGAISTLFRVSDQYIDEILAGGKREQTPDQTDSLVEEDRGFSLDKVEEEALERVKDQVAALGWDELQELVAGLLRGMGYKTRVSPLGPDRGKDIIASPDGFGFESPRIVVEVKHRSQAMGSQEIRSFLGGRHVADKGLYVSTGGFSKDAYYEAERANIPLTLMSLDELVKALLEYYDQLDIETQQLIPLKKIYWPV
ncbi:MAG: restriction endonuclease [Candidatus Thiodiazotropha sp. (ex. Lucinisca nassula)]|nr:restriction endonuclease [Candidatus Thiodiazotropha sp. (ex. Lucinisca nassula)]